MKKKLILIALTLVLSLTTIMACVRPTGDESTFRIAFDMQREWEDEFGFSYPQVALLVRRELAKSNPSFVNAVVSMVESSVDFARENAGETARLVRNELNVAGMPQTNIIETFILGSGQDVFNFQNATESRESVNTFLTELHAVNPQSVGGRLPTDEFYFNPENGDDVGEISGQFSFFVPAGAPMIAAAHMFHYQPRVQYDQREIEFDFQMVMPPQLMSAVNGGLADFAIAPINLAAQRFNAMGNNYVIAGIVMWGLLHIVENYERN
ncbi:MAG: hypothetical protein FWC11_05630, partial [Firmicutes bacterium]|nr:hypothetical protein [Bacillota bacterium]